jgi:autotransporter family porin
MAMRPIGLSGVAALFVAGPVMAANECGPMGTGTTVICDAGTYVGAGDGTLAVPGTSRVHYPGAYTANPTVVLDGLHLDGVFSDGVLLEVTSLGGAVVSTVTMEGGSIVARERAGKGDGIRINHNAPASAGSVVTMNGDAQVRITNGGSSGVFVRQDSAGATGDATIILNHAARILNEPGNEFFSYGAFARIAGSNAGGSAIIVLNDDTRIDTVGEQGLAIIAWLSGSSPTGDATVTLNDNVRISTLGFGGSGASAWVTTSDATGDGVVTMNGNARITTEGDEAYGMAISHLGPGTAILRMTGGTIAVLGVRAHGMYARNSGVGRSEVTMNGGTVATSGADADGLYAFSDGAGATGARVTMLGASGISTEGERALGAHAEISTLTGTGDAVVSLGDSAGIVTRGAEGRGAAATNEGSGAASVTMTGGTVATSGTESDGLYALLSGAGATGDARVTMLGTAGITTDGERASGVLSKIASATATGDAVVSLGDSAGIVTRGAEGRGAAATNEGSGAASVTMTGGTVATSGTESDGLYALLSGAGATGDARVTMLGTAGITTDGERASGVLSEIASAAATGDAVVSLSDSAGILTRGAEGRGAAATNEGSGAASVTMSGGTVATSGTVADGLHALLSGAGATGDARVDVLGTAGITTDGERASGVLSEIASAAATGDAVVSLGDSAGILTRGAEGRGAAATNEGSGAASVTMSGGTVATSGTVADGLYALSSGEDATGDARVTVLGTAGITTDGEQSSGVLSEVTSATATGDAVVSLGDSASIVSRGAGGRGAAASNQGAGAATVTMSGGTVATSGVDADGLYAWISGADATGDARVTLLGSAGITTEGDGSWGVLSEIASATGTGAAVVSLGGSASIVTLGAEGHGAIVLNQGAGEAIIGMTGGTLATSGPGADGLRAEASGSGGVEVTMTGGRVTSGTGQAAGIRTLSANGGTVEIGAAAVIDGSASGIAIRDGDTDRDGTDETGGNVTVTSAGTVTGAAILGLGDDAFTLSGGVFDGDIHGDDIAASLADGDDAFTWTGGLWRSGYFGGNGSDTATISAAGYDGTHHVLDGGDDLSAADGWVDTLTFTGITAVASGANIRNWEVVRLDGARLTISGGALAVGSEAGLGLRLTGGATLDGAGALALTGNLRIDAGASFVATGGGAGVYTISGGLANDGTVTLQDGAAGDRLAVAGDLTGAGWLALDIDTATGAADTVTVAGDMAGTTLIALNNLSPGVADGRSVPLVEVAGDSSAGGFALAGGPLTAGAFDYDLVHGSGAFALSARMNGTGMVYEALPATLAAFRRMPTLEQRLSAGAGTAREPGLGPWLRIHGDRTEMTTDTGTEIDSTTTGLQAGWTVHAAPGGAGDWRFGLTAQYGTQTGRVSGAAGSGRIESTGAGLGATATWFGEDGRYLDLQGQVTWIDTDIASSTAGALASGRRSTASALSVEGGWRHALDETRALVPQAQLTLARLDGARFTDSAGNGIDLGRQTEVTGRLGLAYDWESADLTGGARRQLHVIANVFHDFSGGGTVGIAGAGLGAGTPDTWGEIGIGGSIALGKTTVLYGEASWRTALGDGPGSTSGHAITVGLRHRW